MGKNVINFGDDMSSSVNIDYKNKDMLILSEEPKQELDDTVWTTEAKYPTNFTRSGKIFVLSLRYDESNSFLFVNATIIYQFKAKESEIKYYTLCLGNIYKRLTSIVNASNHTKCVSLSNQKCETQPTLINLHPNHHSQELHYYPFAVTLDKCFGSCNSLKDLSNKVCVPNEKDNLNISMFNMITRINESKTLTRHISCECKCKFDGRKCSSNQWWNNNNIDANAKNIIYVEKIIFGILLLEVSKMVNI